MLIFALICICLSLLGMAGMQILYMLYLEKTSTEHKKRIRQLEHHCKYLTNRLKDAETQIAQNEEFIESIYEESDKEKEVWADVIEE